MQNKRVPRNHNLTIWTDSDFRGLPIDPKYQLVTEYLEKVHGVIDAAMKDHPRTFAVRLDLRCDAPTKELTEGNSVMQRFKDELDRRITYRQEKKAAQGKRVPKSVVRWVWAREQKSSDSPHFHVLLLLNRDVFYSLGDYRPGSAGLLNMIRSVWKSALGIPPDLNPGLIHVPDNPEYHLVTSNQYADLPSLFFRASYLCKVETKTFGRGFQCFGGSSN